MPNNNNPDSNNELNLEIRMEEQKNMDNDELIVKQSSENKTQFSLSQNDIHIGSIFADEATKD